MEADEVIRALELTPHPEGGHYHETWADEASSAIYFLLRREEESAWHRVRDRVEIWHLYRGGPLELTIDTHGIGSEHQRTVIVGADLLAGQRPQAIVPAGAWQRARSLGDWSLMGCTVAPPFTFEAFDLATDHEADSS